MYALVQNYQNGFVQREFIHGRVKYVTKCD